MFSKLNCQSITCGPLSEINYAYYYWIWLQVSLCKTVICVVVISLILDYLYVICSGGEFHSISSRISQYNFWLIPIGHWQFWLRSYWWTQFLAELLLVKNIKYFGSHSVVLGWVLFKFLQDFYGSLFISWTIHHWGIFLSQFVGVQSKSIFCEGRFELFVKFLHFIKICMLESWSLGTIR